MNQKNTTTKYVDHLNEDEPINGQKWVCVSFLSPEGIKNCSVRGLKIRGIYDLREDADKRAKYLQEVDPDFHVFVGEVGKWLPWDPEPNDVADQVYQEKELNDLMKGYKDNLTKAKRLQEQRKSDMLKNAAVEQEQQSQQNQQSSQRNTDPQSRKENQKNKLKKKLQEKKQQKKMEELVKNNKLTPVEEKLEKVGDEIKQEEKLGAEEMKRLNESQKKINDLDGNINDIDGKLAKIQELYKKLNKK